MSVKVAKHPETGAIITVSAKKPEYGTFRVDSTHVSLEGGFTNVQNRTAFIRGKVSDLELLNLKEGQILPGQIVKRESFQPFYDRQTPKIYPTGHERAGQPVLKNGREVYMEYVYTSDTNASSDVWVGDSPAELSEEAKNAIAEQATGE